MPSKDISTLSHAERFWLSVDSTGDCWLWKGPQGPGGYGRFTAAGTKFMSHRYAYESMVGTVPDGLQLDHLCRVRLCVRPSHLEPVTARENVMRGDGITAANAAKEACIRGHAFTPENTYRFPDGRRACRICKAAATKQSEIRAKIARLTAQLGE